MPLSCGLGLRLESQHIIITLLKNLFDTIIGFDQFKDPLLLGREIITIYAKNTQLFCKRKKYHCAYG